MPKRNRSDSTAGILEITNGALTGAPEAPPGVVISKVVKPFWDMVTTAKAKRAWTQNDLVLAADVARTMHRLELINDKLVELYAEIDYQPKLDLIKYWERMADQNAKRVRMLAAHLQIHPEATQGKSREQRDQNAAHADAMQGAHERSNDDDDLIGKPVH